MPKTIKLTAIGIALLVSSTACTSDREGSKGEVGSLVAPAAVATALLQPTEGSEARGTVKFASTADGVRVTVDMTGLEPGEHKIFVQESGDCTEAVADSSKAVAGASSLEADSSGRAHSEFVDTRLALEGQTSIVGRALVVHDKADAAQPAEDDTDADVACGIIVATNP